MAELLRPELPPPPASIAALPVHRGYPVPWFVSWLDDGGNAVARGVGTPDFRVLFPGAFEDAVRNDRCWVCGGKNAPWTAFVIGPMCAINRTSAEPPSHLLCARWSAVACPFLSRPHAERREGNLPPETREAAGIMLRRNPGVALVWISQRGWRVMRTPDGGYLANIGEPEWAEWYREGRDATRAEVNASIESGLPALRELAEAQGAEAVRYLDRKIVEAERWLPHA